jgi:uncharacterized RDD family membrane protein YckC
MTGVSADGERARDDDGEHGDALVDRRWVYADVPNRVIGYLIDAILLTLLTFAGSILISLAFGPVVTIEVSGNPQVTVDTGLAMANAILATALSAFYFTLTWHRFHGSPGLRSLRMRMWAESGGRVSVSQGAIRWLFIGLPLGALGIASIVLGTWAYLALMVAVALWFLFLLVTTARDPRKQGLHDRVAHTVVTKEGREAHGFSGADRLRAADVR